jgi:hypothetical protein
VALVIQIMVGGQFRLPLTLLLRMGLTQTKSTFNGQLPAERLDMIFIGILLTTVKLPVRFGPLLKFTGMILHLHPGKAIIIG